MVYKFFLQFLMKCHYYSLILPFSLVTLKQLALLPFNAVISLYFVSNKVVSSKLEYIIPSFFEKTKPISPIFISDESPVTVGIACPTGNNFCLLNPLVRGSK